jgi:hypothetical protein
MWPIRNRSGEKFEFGLVPEFEDFPPRLPLLPHDPFVLFAKLFGHG